MECTDFNEALCPSRSCILRIKFGFSRQLRQVARGRKYHCSDGNENESRYFSSEGAPRITYYHFNSRLFDKLQNNKIICMNTGYYFHDNFYDNK
jgi:hypothetical protein